MNITRLVGIGSVLLASQWALAELPDPRITIPPTNITVCLGATAQLKCFVYYSHGPATFQWYFKEAAMDTVANPSAATRILSLTNVTLAQAGPYFMVVTDTLSKSATSQVAVLEVTIVSSRLWI